MDTTCYWWVTIVHHGEDYVLYLLLLSIKTFFVDKAAVLPTTNTESPFVNPQSMFKVTRRAAFSSLPGGLARQIRMSIYTISPSIRIGGLFPDRWFHGPLHPLRRRRHLCRDGVVGGSRWGGREVRRHRLRKYHVDVFNVSTSSQCLLQRVKKQPASRGMWCSCLGWIHSKGCVYSVMSIIYLFITTVEQQKCLIVAGTNQSDHRNTVIMYRRSIWSFVYASPELS